jgi:hypothetical protein
VDWQLSNQPGQAPHPVPHGDRGEDEKAHELMEGSSLYDDMIFDYDIETEDGDAVSAPRQQT